MSDALDVAGLVERLREVPRGQGHSLPSEHNGMPCKTVIPYGNMMQEAATALTTLAAENARLREAERSKIVLWLRHEARSIERVPDDIEASTWRTIAFLIEQGGHLGSHDARALIPVQPVEESERG